MPNLLYRILIAISCLIGCQFAASQALAAGTCGEIFSDRTVESQSPIDLDILAAREVIGTWYDGSTALSRLYEYVLSREFSSREQLIKNVKTLMLAISFNSSMAWDFRQLYGSDGAVVFYGGKGYGVVIDPQGLLWKGPITTLNIDYFIPTWDANYSNLKLIERK